MPVWIPWLKVNQPNDKGCGKGNISLGGRTFAPAFYNKGKGKGFSGGGGFSKPWAPRKPPNLVPEGFQVDTAARYTGSVKFYKKFSGFGFVELKQKGIVPEDSVYVHWRAIQTEDRYPQLVQDMDIELSLHKVQDKRSGGYTIKAKDVTMPGGNPVALQDDLDAQNLQFVGGQHLRYTGQLQFFSPKRGFGWLTMDDGYALPEPVPKELRVDMPEVNAGGKQPPFMREVAVEFGIMKTKKGYFKGYNMTLPGGIPMTQEGLEHRVVLGSRTFTGNVEIFNWRKGWGFIKGSPGAVYPPNVVAKIKQMQDACKARGKAADQPMLYFRRDDLAPGMQVDQGTQVTFKVYTDDKGAGACEIH